MFDMSLLWMLDDALHIERFKVKCEVRVCEVVICEVSCEVCSARHG